jgi:hypothetical protein
MSIQATIAADRTLLDRGGRFARTSAYAPLRATALGQMGADSEPWLAHKPVRLAFGLGQRPIDTVSEPAGIDVLAEHATRIAYDCA